MDDNQVSKQVNNTATLLFPVLKCKIIPLTQLIISPVQAKDNNEINIKAITD